MIRFFARLCIALLGLLACSLPLLADYQDGYVITLNEDTLYGKIYIGSPQSMAHRCRFRSTETGKTTRFKPDELKGFATTDHSRRFVSDTVPYYFKDRRIFLEVLQAGRINLFYTYDLILNHIFYIKKQDSNLTDLIFDWSENKRIALKANFTKTLKKFMKDAPELLPEIEYIKKASPNALYELVGRYNRRFEKTTQMSVLPEPPPVARFQKELGWSVSPGIVVPDIMYLNNRYLDAFLGFSLTKGPSQVRNGMYLTAGVYKPQFSVTTKYNLLSTLPALYSRDYDYLILVPVRVAYHFSSHNLQPMVGLELQSYLNNVDNYYTLGPTFGLVYTPLKWVSLSCSSQYILSKFNHQTYDLLLTSFFNLTTGISINF